MSDMIQINIQAVLDGKSKEQILSSIESIRKEISNSPFAIKVETDSETLNALAEKIKVLGSEASSPIKLNLDSSGVDKVSEKFKVFTDEAGNEVEKISLKTKEFTNNLGQGVKEVQSFKTIIGETGDFTTALADKTVIYTDKLKVARDEADKLANAIGIANEKSQLRVSDQNNRSDLAQNTAINNAMDNNYAQFQREEQARVSAHQEASDMARKINVEEENQRVAITTSAQRQIEQAILGSNETIAQAQTRMNSSQENGNKYEQMYLQALKEQGVLETKNAEIETQQTVELQRQIALYQERNALSVRNMQSQFGSLAQTPAVQSQVSAITALSGGLSNATDVEAFKAQSAQVTTATNNMRAGLNEARASSHGFGADLANNAIKMAEWTVVGGAIFGTLKQIKDGFAFVNEINKNTTNIEFITGQSHEAVMQMTQDYSALAGQLHETTGEIMTASEEFLRAGNNAQQTADLLKASTVMSKLAGQSQSESAQSLISVMNSYKMSAGDMMGVVDKMVAVDNNSATSTKELSSAIQKTASTARASGVSLSELISYIGTISSVTRVSADSIGTSLNSIFSRYENVKAGVMNDVDGMPLNNVEKVLNNVGISIRSSSGEFKNFNDVLNTVSASWNKYDGVTKGAIATAVAGRVA